MSYKWLSDFLKNVMDTAEHTTTFVCLLPLCARNVKTQFVTYLL